MDKKNYNRVAEDKAQLNKFVADTCEATSQGGGTQLYKHTVAIDLYVEGNELHTTCIFITTDSASLKDTKADVYNKGYVSGVVDMSGEGYNWTPIITITGEGEPGLLYIDTYGNMARADMSYLGNDTVTKL